MVRKLQNWYPSRENLSKPNEVCFDEVTKKKLSQSIEEINAAYNASLDVDVASKSALQMRDLLRDNDEEKHELMQVFLEDVYRNLRETEIV